MTVESAVEETVLKLAADRWSAHRLLFAHRRTKPPAQAHQDMVAAIYAPHPRQLIEGFRGISKTTHLEEAAVIKALFREFRNMVIVGASYTRACERVESIKRELDQNEDIANLFGRLRGHIWQEGKIVLSTGICIQALGRDQSTLGIKYLDWRPDAALVDDVEDPEEKRSDAEREETWRWFIRTFLPSLDHPLYSWVRVLGTRRGVGSLPERLEKDGWPVAKYPIEYLDERGRRQATWPGKFPLSDIDIMRRTYRGDMHTWMQEFMCQAMSQADRVFTRDMFRVEPRERSWHAVYAMIDPARTVNRNSATTGWAVWSWIGARLIVWAAGAEMLKPDAIIALCFAIAEGYNPTWIGVEEDGLNEFILQPLRHEQARRGHIIPIRPVHAPRGKLDFIRGLQPFFAAREVVFNAPLPELEEQLLSFPSGRIDAPNALAYALQMRPAAPIYDGFSDESIADELEPDPARPFYLAANATGSITTAILCQLVDGQFRIYADWVREGSASEAVAEIYGEAALVGDARLAATPSSRDWREALKLPTAHLTYRRQKPKWIVPPHHGNTWNNVGLEQAIRRLPAQLSRGATEGGGRDRLRSLLATNVHSGSAVVVSERAAWTLRAFAGGYTRALRRGGGLADHAEEGVYRVLMEGLESFVGMTAGQTDDEDDDNAQPFGVTRSGVRYRSAMPQRSS